MRKTFIGLWRMVCVIRGNGEKSGIGEKMEVGGEKGEEVKVI